MVDIEKLLSEIGDEKLYISENTRSSFSLYKYYVEITSVDGYHMVCRYGSTRELVLKQAFEDIRSNLWSLLEYMAENGE